MNHVMLHKSFFYDAKSKLDLEFFVELPFPPTKDVILRFRDYEFQCQRIEFDITYRTFHCYELNETGDRDFERCLAFYKERFWYLPK